MSQALAFGLVGLGVHGERYAGHLLRDVHGARLAAVCRRDRKAGEAFARRHGVDYMADWRQLVAHPEVQAIAVVTPSALTAGVSLAAVQAGHPVLIEKPLATCRESASQLLQAVARAPAPVMVAQTMRWDAAVTALRAALHRIGTIRLLTLAQRLEAPGRTWLDHDSGGDVLLNTGVHAFDLLRFLTGREVREVSCRSRSACNGGQPDTFVAHLTLEGGIPATVDNCRASGARAGRIEVVGSEGTLVADTVQGRLALHRGRDVEPLAVGDPVPTVRAALQSFVGVVRHGAPVPVSAEDGWRAVEIALACQFSAGQGGQPAAVTA